MAMKPVIDDEPCLSIESEKKLMDEILVLFIKNKLTLRQSQDLLERWGGIIEKLQQEAKFRRPPQRVSLKA